MTKNISETMKSNQDESQISGKVHFMIDVILCSY